MASSEENDIEIEMEDVETYLNKPSKRVREEVEEEAIEDEWETVKGKSKKLRQEEEKKTKETKEENKNAEIYISCQELMPKQFALARLFKDLKIGDIINIKYLNPYKIRVKFSDEKNIESLISNEVLKNKGWRFNNLSEVSYSLGVIKDVDLELSEEEIMKNITCPESVELISLKRLERRSRDKDVKWKPSESVRLCFKGNWLPPYVYVHDVRVIIDPYVYPVTQCYLCWKLGHTVRTCTVRKEVCPKCSGDHANCETKVFKCINCSGSHMAMARTCPAYMKEKTIREIMAEYNYTYSKASQMYAASPTIVPAEMKRDPRAKLQTVTSTNQTGVFSQFPCEVKPTVDKTSDVQSEKSFVFPTKQQKKKIKKNTPSSRENYKSEWDFVLQEEPEGETSQQDFTSMNSEKPTFGELLCRIKEVIFLNNLDLQSKVKSVIQLCMEWFIIVAVDHVSDWPMFKLVYGLICHNYV